MFVGSSVSETIFLFSLLFFLFLSWRRLFPLTHLGGVFPLPSGGGIQFRRSRGGQQHHAKEEEEGSTTEEKELFFFSLLFSFFLFFEKLFPLCFSTSFLFYPFYFFSFSGFFHLFACSPSVPWLVSFLVVSASVARTIRRSF